MNIFPLHFIQKTLFFLLLIALELACYSSHAQCIEENTAFDSGELLNYRGYYNLGFIWVAAGEVQLRTKKTQYGGKDAYQLMGTGKSLKAFDWFFHLRDTLISYVDAETLLPFHFDRRTHEGKYHAHHQYWFNHDSNTIHSKIQKRERPVKLDSLENKPCTFDLLSVAYYARNINFNKHKKDDKIPVSVLIDNKIHSLYIRYKGTETVKTKSGKRFECFKFSPLLLKGNVFEGGEDMTVWLSKDKNRIPIMIEAKILVGSVKGVLESHQNLRNK